MILGGIKKLFVVLFLLALVGGGSLMNDGIDFGAPAGGHAVSGTVRFIQTMFTTAQADGLGSSDKKSGN
jgi:hypothetical protein